MGIVPCCGEDGGNCKTLLRETAVDLWDAMQTADSLDSIQAYAAH
ncbi:MAG: hypothetical protein R6X34_20670 [Chloroflexota bacterium]